MADELEPRDQAETAAAEEMVSEGGPVEEAMAALVEPVGDIDPTTELQPEPEPEEEIEPERLQGCRQLQSTARDIGLRTFLNMDNGSITDHLRRLGCRGPIDRDTAALDQIPSLRTRRRKPALDEGPVQTQLF